MDPYVIAFVFNIRFVRSCVPFRIFLEMIYDPCQVVFQIRAKLISVAFITCSNAWTSYTDTIPIGA